ELAELRRQRGQAVRLDAEEDDVGGADGAEVAGRMGLDLEVTIGTDDAKPSLLHRLQVRAACVEDHVAAGSCEPGTDIPADGACAGDDDFHEFRGRLPAAVSCREVAGASSDGRLGGRSDVLNG